MQAIETILPEVGPPRGAPSQLDADLRSKFVTAMPGLKERAKTLIELLDSAYYLYAQRPLSIEPKAEALLADGGRDRIAGLLPHLAALPEWSRPRRKARCADFGEESALKLGQVAQPLRAALTGRATSPGLFDVMTVLGREECLARLHDQLSKVEV